MLKKKTCQRHIRKIQKSNVGTYYVTLPIELIRQLKWQDRQQVEIKLFGKKKLMMRDWEA